MSTPPVPGRARSGDGRADTVPRAWAHWHRFRWAGTDAFSGSSLYACRCGVIRPGI